jgi:small ligand-binding sensory domain FIST
MAAATTGLSPRDSARHRAVGGYASAGAVHGDEAQVSALRRHRDGFLDRLLRGHVRGQPVVDPACREMLDDLLVLAGAGHRAGP